MQAIMNWVIPSALALLSLGAHSAAGAADREVKVSGLGVRKCVEWNRWKEVRNGEARALMVEWTQGFLAGHNVYARLGGPGAGAVTASSSVILTLLDARCQAAPEARMLEVVVQLAAGLGGSKVELQSREAPLPGIQPGTDSGGARGL